MKGSIGKLPSTMLLDSIFESLAFGVSGFLMSFVVIFVSRSKDMKPVIYAAVIVAVLPVIVRTGFISSSLSLFFKIYSLLNIILSEVFLFGFAVLGARFLTKINRLKSEKIESESI